MENENNNSNYMPNDEKKKKSYWSLIVIIILIIVALIAFFNKKSTPTTNNTTNTPSDIKVVNVSASDGTSTLNITFNNSDSATSTVTFSWNGQTYTLPRAMSGSGARYSESFNEVDKGMQLWEHQGEITISNDGVTLFSGKEIANQ